MANDSLFRRAGIVLGLVEDTQKRSELPILTSPNAPLNAVNLTGRNTTAVSVDRALGLAGVFRAVNILSTSVSQLDLGVWRNGEELPLKTTDLVVRPNLDISRPAFLEQTVNSLALSGNAFWLLKRQSKEGPVGSIEVLDPNGVHVETLNGKRVYRYGDKTYQDWQVKHLWHFRVPGYALGIGPIQAAQNELRGALDLRNYSDNWFREAGVPNGILKTEQVLAAEQAEAYRAEWDRRAGTGRGTAVLGQGMSYQPVYLAPADAQFIESQQFSVTQIARMFGIPATYLMTGVEGNSMTYTNTEQIDITYVKYTLTKYLSEIESALSDLLPRGQEARFKVETLLRGDQKTRFDGYKVAIEAGWLLPNEVRSKEGLLPIPGLDDQKKANPNEVGTNE